MADFGTAIAAVMENESSALLNDSTTGEYSRYGVTLKTAVALGFCASHDTGFIDTLDLAQAEKIYEAKWWEPLLLDGCRNQALANKILDMAVNMGPVEAVKLLQASLNTLHSKLAVDGKLGPNTLSATNGADPFELLTELRANSTAFYYHLVEQNQAKYAKYWEGWKARAAK